MVDFRGSGLVPKLRDWLKLFRPLDWQQAAEMFDDRYADWVDTLPDLERYENELWRLRWLACIKGGMNVLDFGCNTGRVTEKLCLRGVKAVGVDLNAAAIAKAIAGRSQGEFHCVESLPAQLPFPDGHFDRVLMLLVLTNLVGDPVHVLKELRRVLNAEGKLCMMCRCRAYKIACLPQNLFNGYEPDMTTTTYYSVRKIRKMLSAAGMNVKVIDRVGELPFWVPRWLPSSMTGMLRSRMLIVAEDEDAEV